MIIVILKIIAIMLTIACISGQTILRQSGGAASQDPEGRHVTLVVSDRDHGDDSDDYDVFDHDQ